PDIRTHGEPMDNMRRLLPLAALAILPLFRPLGEGPAPLAPDRAPASLIPERCLIFLDGSGLRPWFEQGLAHPCARRVLEVELGKALLARAPLAPEDALAKADAWLGEPVLPWIAGLARRGLGLGFDPATKKSVLVALGDDDARVAQALARALGAIERQFGLP